MTLKLILSSTSNASCWNVLSVHCAECICFGWMKNGGEWVGGLCKWNRHSEITFSLLWQVLARLITGLKLNKCSNYEYIEWNIAHPFIYSYCNFEASTAAGRKLKANLITHIPCTHIQRERYIYIRAPDANVCQRLWLMSLCVKGCGNSCILLGLPNLVFQISSRFRVFIWKYR